MRRKRRRATQWSWWVKSRELYKILLLAGAIEPGGFIRKTDLGDLLGTRNMRYLNNIIETGRKYGIVEVSPSGRDLWLTEKGREFRRAAGDVLDFLEGKRATVRTMRGIEAAPRLPESEAAMGKATGELPSFIRGNPWLRVLAKRGR